MTPAEIKTVLVELVRTMRSTNTIPAGTHDQLSAIRTLVGTMPDARTLEEIAAADGPVRSELLGLLREADLVLAETTG